MYKKNSIEKIDGKKIRQEGHGYTMNRNDVLQNIPNASALGIYIYLSSLPPDWVIYKTKIREHFGMGRDQLDRLFKYLIDHKLLEYVRERNENGTLGNGYFLLKNGSEFIKPAPKKKNDKKQNKTIGYAILVSSNGKKIKPHTEFQCSGQPGPGFDTPTKEIIKNKRLKIKDKEKDIVRSGRFSEELKQKLFEQFWQAYPKKEGKKKAFEIWKKNKLYEMGEKIINDVITRKSNHSVWLDGFIPLATTYLNGERWDDEIKLSRGKIVSPYYPEKKEQKESYLDRSIRKLKESKNGIRNY